MHESDSIGNWLHTELHAELQFEATGWATESVQKVGDRLQANRPISDRLQVEVPQLLEFTAFTAPGRYIYISRSLLELCRDDEMVAFVIAHELAHHDLGHLDMYPDWLVRLTGAELAPLLTLFFRYAVGRIYNPEAECLADRHALKLCMAAGYDAHSCIAFFDMAEKYALDIGDIGMVFGPAESDDELAEDAPGLMMA